MTWSDGKTETVNPPPVVASAPGSTTGSKSGSSNKATVALILAIIALVAGLAALGLVLARRGSSSPASPEDKAAASTW
jgi:hypothetical protein